VRGFIEGSLSHLKEHPDGSLMLNGEVVKPIRVSMKKVKEEIRVIEGKLLQAYSDYDRYNPDYSLGDLSCSWTNFCDKFIKLFSKDLKSFPD
jgi:hypothetical protein